MSLKQSVKTRGFDKADLEILDMSFSDDISPAGTLKAEPLRSTPTKSPVKAQNHQFVNDFDDDFSSEISDDELDKLLVNRSPPKSSKKSIEDHVRSFAETPIKTPSRIKLSQISTSILESSKKPKLEDLEDIFKDDDWSDNSQQQAAVDQISISALETSSPTYHRTETLLKKPQVPVPEVSNKVLTSSFLRSTSDLGEPVNTSTQVNNSPLYPQMKSYNEKYPLPPPAPLNKPSKEVLQKSAQKAKVPPIPNFFDFAKTKVQTPVPVTEPANEVSDNIEPKPQTRDTRGHSPPPKPHVAKRVKQNSELLLLTQRPSVFYGNSQARAMSTTPINQSLFDQRAAAPKTVQPFSLSEEQSHVQALVLEGKSLFYTGSAGTGKSVLLRSIVKALKHKYRDEPSAVAVTASTGLAAVNIGGSTLHSFAGIGLGNDTVQNLIRKVRRSHKAKTKWMTTRVLIIDEISMISGELLTKLDQIGRNLRKNHQQPFGGIQVIACGDFFQLPPVVKEDEEGNSQRFCFQSPVWKECMKINITLQEVFRQKGDMEFINMLNDMRLGIVTPESERKFRELERELPNDDIEPAELYSTRGEVERANYTRLSKIRAPPRVFNAVDAGSLKDPEARNRMLSNFMAPEQLTLKKGAQVMLIKNLDESLVNGSLGKVIDFMDRQTYLSYTKLKEDSNYSVANLESDVHGSITKDKALSELEDKNLITGETRLPPNAEVETLEETIFGFMDNIETDDPEALENIQRKKTLMNQLHQSSRDQKLPLVRFLTPDNQSRYILVTPESWTVDDEHQMPLVSRIQIPLILAWALSIHKSQGQTLPRVRVNLRRIFEKGQAYVAISRAVSREGLQVLNFDKSKVYAHDQVKEFYQSLKSVNEFYQPRPVKSLLGDNRTPFKRPEPINNNTRETPRQYIPPERVQQTVQPVDNSLDSFIFDGEEFPSDDEGAFIDAEEDVIPEGDIIELTPEAFRASMESSDSRVILDRRMTRKRNRDNKGLYIEDDSHDAGSEAYMNT